MRRAVIDIETVPTAFGAAEWNVEQRKKASLDALTSRIVCIGVVMVDGFEAKSAAAFTSEDEAELLRSFWSYLGQNKVFRFITHNGLSFDLPFLWRRSVILNVKPVVNLDLRKYRTDFVFDTMCVWGNWEMRNSVSLEALSEALGLGRKTGGAEEVFGLWRAKEYSKLADYCLRDCWLTYACYCRIHFAVPIVQEDIPSDIRGTELCVPV